MQSGCNCYFAMYLKESGAHLVHNPSQYQVIACKTTSVTLILSRIWVNIY